MQKKIGGLWVWNSAWCEKGMMRELCKNALRVFREIKVRACVHCFCLAKPLGIAFMLTFATGTYTKHCSTKYMQAILYTCILLNTYLLCGICSSIVHQTSAKAVPHAMHCVRYALGMQKYLAALHH